MKLIKISENDIIQLKWCLWVKNYITYKISIVKYYNTYYRIYYNYVLQVRRRHGVMQPLGWPKKKIKEIGAWQKKIPQKNATKMERDRPVTLAWHAWRAGWPAGRPAGHLFLGIHSNRQPSVAITLCRSKTVFF